MHPQPAIQFVVVVLVVRLHDLQARKVRPGQEADTVGHDHSEGLLYDLGRVERLVFRVRPV